LVNLKTLFYHSRSQRLITTCG